MTGGPHQGKDDAEKRGAGQEQGEKEQRPMDSKGRETRGRQHDQQWQRVRPDIRGPSETTPRGREEKLRKSSTGAASDKQLMGARARERTRQSSGGPQRPIGPSLSDSSFQTSSRARHCAGRRGSRCLVPGVSCGGNTESPGQ